MIEVTDAKMIEIPVKISKSNIKFVLEENHAFPSVAVGVFVKSGARYEPKENLGIAHFIEHSVFKETLKRSAYEISHEIESLGGELNAFTSSEYSLFYVKLLSRDIRTGLDVISDILINPTFNQELIERERQVILEEINEYFDDPQDICQTEALKSLWGNDPASHNPLGEEDTVSGITRDKLCNYYKMHFNKGNIFISVVGDINESTLEHHIEEYFSGLNGDCYVPEVKMPEYSFETKEIEKDTSQVHLAVTLKGSGLFSKEHLLNSLFTTILGGNMSSRLFQKLREEKGLVYTVYAYPVRLTDTGGSVIYVSTTPKNLDEVSGLIYGEIDTVKKKGFSENEFDDAKKYLIGSLILGLESMTNRMQRNGVLGLFLGRVETVQELMSKLENITFEDFSYYVNMLIDSRSGRVIVGKV